MAVRTYRDKTGSRYVVEFQSKGQRVLRRLPRGASKGEAAALEARLRSELFRQVDLGIKPEITLEETILRWLNDTLHQKKDKEMPAINARLLAPFVVGKTILQAPEASREASATWAHLAPATVNRRLCVLKAACTHAFKMNWVTENVSARINMLPEHNKREVYLTLKQVVTLSEKAHHPKVKVAILIAAYTGLRASELLALGLQDLHGDTLHVRQSKTGKPRIVPVSSSCLPLLADLPLGLSYSQLRSDFGQARIKAGLSHVHFHDLRHTTASWLINQGVDLYTVGKILGHSAPVTTARYAHLSHETLRSAMKRLDVMGS